MSVERLVEHFSALEDPRCAGKVEHRLIDILVIAASATHETTKIRSLKKSVKLAFWLQKQGHNPSYITPAASMGTQSGQWWHSYGMVHCIPYPPKWGLISLEQSTGEIIALVA